MAVRGIRGATTVEENSKEEIIEKTRELLESLIKKNNIVVDDVASATFSVTEELNAEFPAVAARDIGWIFTPLFCTREIPVQGSLKNCIRVLLHVNSETAQKDIIHAYLHGAKKLRPDLESNNEDKYYSSEK